MGVVAKMKGEKVHVRDADRRDRMICGRRDTGLETVALEACESVTELCSKCRLQVGWARALERLSRQPLPAGYQYSLWEDRAALDRRRRKAG